MSSSINNDFISKPKFTVPPSTFITPLEKESTGEGGPTNVKELAVLGASNVFAVSQGLIEVKDHAPRPSFTNTMPPDTQPTAEVITNMIQRARIEADVQPSHLGEIGQNLQKCV